MNPWTVLGLPPGADRDAIRRAYARKLKGVNPEDDPEGFMALRAAHDAALQQLKWRQQWPDEADDDGDDAADDAPDQAPDQAGPGIPPPPAPPPASPPPAPPPRAPVEPAPIDPAAAALAAERAADQADLAARQQALIAAIETGADQPEQHRALAELMAAPALIDIVARDRIEIWVASLLARRLPASDPLVVRAIETFGWAELAPGQRNPDVDTLLRRREEGEFVVEIARRHTPLHQGYVALTTPPGAGWWQHLKALFSAEPAQTRQLLGLIDGPLPGMADWLNADAIAWWRRYHDKPRLRLWMILTMVPLAAVLLVAALDGAGWPEPLTMLFGLLAWAAPWGLLWLLRRRQAWMADWDRPDWHFAAFPLSVLALPLLAALWPAVPVLQPLFLLPLLLACGWLLLAADTLHPGGWGELAPGLIRALPAWLVLAVLVGGAPARDGLGTVRALALFGCMLAWWQAGDQLGWAARRLLARRSDRLGGAWAPWAVLAAGVLVALLATGLALLDERLVGRALGLMALPLLAALLALRMTSGWQQLGPFAALAGLLLLVLELLGLIDPGVAGSGALHGLGEGGWLIDERTGLPRGGLLFVAVFAATTLWRRWRGPAGPQRFALVAFVIAVLALIWLRQTGDDRPTPAPVARTGSMVQAARPDGDPATWVDAAAITPAPPPGDYRYTVRLALSRRGQVILCSMERSTGLASLDQALCRQFRARARFIPARNAQGEPTATIADFSGRVSWKAAPAPSPPPAPPPVNCPAASASGPMVAEPCMPDRWFYDGSYPAAALAAGHSGTVSYRIAVGKDGRVAACSIETSSGHASLDRGTCAILKARARFVPARDVDGSAMEWDYRGSIRWELAPR